MRRPSESPLFESTRIGLSRVRSQYFKRKFPQAFEAARKISHCLGGPRTNFACAMNYLRGASGRGHSLLLQNVNVIVKIDFDGRLIDKVPVEFATGLQSLNWRAGKADRGGKLLRIL